MPTDLPTYLAHLETLADKATPGPLHITEDHIHTPEGETMLKVYTGLNAANTNYFAACAPEVIRCLVAVARAADHCAADLEGNADSRIGGGLTRIETGRVHSLLLAVDALTALAEGDHADPQREE